MSWCEPVNAPREASQSPVYASSYSSLPQTSAVQFLARFAERDNINQPPTDVQEGAEIEGYRLGKIIGMGASSQCREGCKIERPGERLALKIISCAGAHDTLEHEIDIWSRIKHSRFLKLLDVIRLHDFTIIVSPLASQGSLLKRLKENGPLSIAEAKMVFKELCDALHHLHIEQRIVHHDIKLENILLDADMHPYICDFGLSEYIDEPSTWCMGNCTQEDLMMKGTLWYLPPEVIDCTRSRRHSIIKEPVLAEGDWRLEKTKVDIWALGVVLYAMVTASLPFCQDFLPLLQQAILNGEYTPLNTVLDADNHLCDLVAWLLQPDPERRPLISEVLGHSWLHS